MRYLDTNSIIFIFTLITIAGFFLGHAMNGVLEEEGFGPYGNMSVIMTGFLVGLYSASYLGFNMRDYRIAALGGLIGAFALLAFLVLTRNVMRRAGY